jgi:hypothetical protein
MQPITTQCLSGRSILFVAIVEIEEHWYGPSESSNIHGTFLGWFLQAKK